MTNKTLKNVHTDLGHGSHADMVKECISLNVMTRKLGLRISAKIQECGHCTNRGRNSKQKKQKKKTVSTPTSL